MSTCSVATGLLAFVAVVHIIITVTLTALVVLVRCYCKVKDSSSNTPQQEIIRQSQDQNSNETYKHQVGQVSPPRLRVSPAKDDIPEKLFLSTSLPQPLESEIYDNQGVLETWNQQDLESTQKMKNKLEDQRKDSISSIKKPTSPFRRLSSPLTRSGRLSIASITSKFSRKSVDMGGETVNLMASPATSPTDNQPPSLNLGSNTTDGVEAACHSVLQHEGDSTSDSEISPTIIILTNSAEQESKC